MTRRREEVVLDIRDLRVDYGTGAEAVHAVRGVDLALHRGEMLGVAGESGSGKSTLAYAITRLLPLPGTVTGGDVIYYPGLDRGRDGEPFDVLAASPEALRRFRWQEVAVVFQAAMSALNPVLDVHTQLTDTLRAHRPGTTRATRRERAAELLELVGIDADRMNAYPHQLSGGQRQRIMIAMALALEPEVIIMDEPTTALDVVVQRSILRRVMELRARLDCAIVFITHDLSLLLETADTIAVMYAGHVVERADATTLVNAPQHPYTKGLLSSFPVLHGPRRPLVGVEGSPPDLRSVTPGCPFRPRCPEAGSDCEQTLPPLLDVQPGQQVACLRRHPTPAAGATRSSEEVEIQA
jgi:peptide/nickel transport system ATP-binding protein